MNKTETNVPTRLLGLVYSALFAFLLLAATERPAMAYTDPGSGALLWQALLAGVAGLMFYVRRLAIWFRNRSGRKE